ncbi:hypothetical protein QBC34DRAFT_475334 [Podospora aff. communis PSN243]|uniref:Uncharacterized protein n=1 Tax=Podospora aff. communis PSN243 TaxID=3040156 RepID=A0AAV9G618_9PEZI|nr:hypothetical protein QBC34DRAFT_475334 [Podospora aff. communis PSN243]
MGARLRGAPRTPARPHSPDSQRRAEINRKLRRTTAAFGPGSPSVIETGSLFSFAVHLKLAPGLFAAGFIIDSTEISMLQVVSEGRYKLIRENTFHIPVVKVVRTFASAAEALSGESDELLAFVFKDVRCRAPAMEDKFVISCKFSYFVRPSLVPQTVEVLSEPIALVEKSGGESSSDQNSADVARRKRQMDEYNSKRPDWWLEFEYGRYMLDPKRRAYMVDSDEDEPSGSVRRGG